MCCPAGSWLHALPLPFSALLYPLHKQQLSCLCLTFTKTQPYNRLTILAAGGGEDVLLHSVFANQAVDGHLLLLPNAVAARHRLQVILQQAAVKLPQPNPCSCGQQHLE